MNRNRMEAFSDGVLAIVITIMVLELKTPKSISFEGILEIYPILLSYILSYIYVGIYWLNHHHLVSAVNLVSGNILWGNLHWLFWMSLIPVATEWTGLHPLAKFPTFVYGLILFMCAVSYHILQTSIIKRSGKHSKLAQSIGKDFKGKLSIIAYAAAVVFAIYLPMISYCIYTLIALLWIIPDNRVEKIMENQDIFKS